MSEPLDSDPLVDTPRPKLRRVDREQPIPSMPLEDLLDHDHQARQVWDFVQGLDLSPLYITIRSFEGGPGRPSITLASNILTSHGRQHIGHRGVGSNS